jgi:hypothetical protein
MRNVEGVGEFPLKVWVSAEFNVPQLIGIIHNILSALSAAREGREESWCQVAK